MDLFEYIDRHDLNMLIAEDLVGVRHHPQFPDLCILNYTHKAQGSDMWWNETLRKCRGLIFMDPPGGPRDIVAIPWEKFFNYGDSNTGEINPDLPVVVTDKAESLGILYHTPDGGKAVATRGSFDSPQALHATEWLNTHMPDFEWAGWIMTPLVEIVYPENRIVLNYEGRDELILLGATSIGTSGVSYLSTKDAAWLLGWDGSTTETFTARCTTPQGAVPTSVRVRKLT